MTDNNELMQAVLKKALGFSSTESIEEFIIEDGRPVLSKQRIITKDVPPDIAAAKLIMEQAADPFEKLTDEQLEEEKQRLIGLLKQNNMSEGK